MRKNDVENQLNANPIPVEIEAGDKCDDSSEKNMFHDVEVKVQVRFVPELGRQRLEAYFFPIDHHKCDCP